MSRILHFRLFNAVATILLLCGWAQAQESRTPNAFVVSAGIDNYPAINDLRGCVNDARNTTAAFRAQQGTLFGDVSATTLVDSDATRNAILRSWNDLTQRGEAGDVMVLFLSGHGSRGAGGWSFLPSDFQPRDPAGTAISHRAILETADALATQGKKVFLIVDACFAGGLGMAAKPILNKHRDPVGGGVVLMLSSRADQTSVALGSYSAFAKAFVDSMTADGDLNGDGKVTIDEIRQVTPRGTANYLAAHRVDTPQDPEIYWSKSMGADYPLAMPRSVAGLGKKPRPMETPEPSARPETDTVWTGRETLPGYGRLTFTFQPRGRAIMHDTRGAQEGRFEIDGAAVRIWFDGGRIQYTGVIANGMMSGSAQNDRTDWLWSATAINRP